VPAELLSGTTHEDWRELRDRLRHAARRGRFDPRRGVHAGGLVAGLERKLSKAADYERFVSSLVKIQTFTAIEGNRHWTGRLTGFKNGVATLDLTAVKQKGKRRKLRQKRTRARQWRSR